MTKHSVGFTGTRYGMWTAQNKKVRELIETVPSGDDIERWLHHGQCVGADEEVHNIAYGLGFYIELHPPSDQTWRFEIIEDGHPRIKKRQAKPFIPRNLDIIAASDWLIAAPYNYEPHGRGGGTWFTIGAAQRKRIRWTIVFPDGSTAGVARCPVLE